LDAAAAELHADFDDLAPEGGFGPSLPRGRAAGFSPGEIDELDIEEVEDADDLELDEDDDDDDDALESGFRTDSPRAVDEEIDPELELEIRKEIEEIEELEREMGLRGPAEARPRRGDDRPGPGRSPRGRGIVKPPIQEIFRRGDEVLVQVIKESIGTKGPTLSTYISIPGRYLVLMPGLNRVGVSRKIVDEGQRRKLREIMHELNPPKGLGFIVRTAGLERTKRELARDLAYLLRLWKVILRRIKKTRAPGPIYQESDMITRTIRDIFTSEIDTIWIDEPAAFERAQEFLRVVMPRFVNRIKLYDEKVPLFHKYGIEDEMAKIQRRHVPLPEGGSIVIDQTEALVAIDVNSGNFRVEDDAERTAFEMNLRAAKEIARQLRLRDLGGVIVNDFIDMREERHRRGVERALREAIKRDRARTKVLRMSAFGLIEMTRQRIRPSLKRSIYEDCPHCAGAGVVKTAESMAIDVMRLLALASHRDDIRRMNVTVNPSVATYLNNRKRKEITRIETECHMTIQVGFKDNVPAEHLQIECFDASSSEVRLIPLPAPTHKRGH
jgi:ribonuclease E